MVEATVARLAIIGRAALRQAVQRIGAAPDAHRPRLLRVLERIGDPGILPTVRPFLAHDDADVATAAVDAMGALLDASDSHVSATALDALTATLLDTSRPDIVRLRAFDAITGTADRSSTYDTDIVEPLRAQLRRDTSAALREAAGGDQDGAGEHGGDIDRAPDAELDAILARDLPGSPEEFRLLIAAAGTDAPLTTIHRAIERVRAHETSVAADDVEPWRVVRATAHLALAARGSRLAVYDLREALEKLGAHTPVGMLSALQQVGDASVLDEVADAWQAIGDPWFRDQLVAIFRAVVARERITKRHAIAKKLAARLPEASAALWG